MENEGLENVGVVSRVDNTSEKSNTGKIARMENEGLENVGGFNKGRKCRSGKCDTGKIVRMENKGLENVGGFGRVENTGVNKAIRAKLQGWKMKDWKMWE